MLGYFQHNLSPFLIEFGNGFGIRYYGLAYVLGFIAFYQGLRWQIRQGWCRLPLSLVDDFVFWICLLGVVVGGRLGYALFYDFPAVYHNPLLLLKIWQGGMASHGGILGVIGVMLWYARKVKIPFYNLADACALMTPIGLGLGRIANFINGELWGRPTEVSWAVLFPESTRIYGAIVPRHPSQLYAAFLEGFVLFSLLLFLRYRTRKEGVVALTFVGAYGILRMVGEQYREPDAQIGYYFETVTQGQLLSGGMILIALVLGVRLATSSAQKN